MCVCETGSVCVCVDERGEQAVEGEVMNESGCVCANVYCKFSETKNNVPSLYRIGGCLIPTIFKPISRLTASRSEGCSSRERVDPGRYVPPVLLDYGLGADGRKGVT